MEAQYRVAGHNQDSVPSAAKPRGIADGTGTVAAKTVGDGAEVIG